MEKSIGKNLIVHPMIRYLTVFLTFLAFLPACKKEAFIPTLVPFTEGENETITKWKNDKLSLFVHFGLYSMYGGVYQGQPVTKGYSEQIMAHAPIPAEEYRASAAQFNPDSWNADSIANLAYRGGLKSVIITAKHHDGFCMFDSRHSEFSITKASPFKRDLVSEMSEACKKIGLGFGVYYSLIDWNAPEGATPVSGHNADSISEALHRLNVNQVTELCQHYGPLREIWFDMGTLTPAQSKEIRKVVKDLQPECLISGRLGNGQGDFIVLGDNQIPEVKFDQPWQTPVSINKATWGYRSWQERPDLNKRLQEMLSDLTQVVSKGGNFLINIGPKGDGSVDPFEKDLILGMGQWLNLHGEAIYNTRPFPISDKPWGVFTYSPGNVFIHITRIPDEGSLILYGLNNPISGIWSLVNPAEIASYSVTGKVTTIDLGMIPLRFEPSTILRLQYMGDQLDITPAKLVYSDASGKYELNARNANISWGMDGTNYYSAAPSVTRYSWDISNPKDIDYSMMLFYTQEEKNKRIRLKVNGHEEILDLSKYKTFRQAPESTNAVPSIANLKGPYPGLDMNSHPALISYMSPTEGWGSDLTPWNPIPGSEEGKFLQVTMPPMSACYYLFNILASQPEKKICAMGTDDAFMIWLNGKQLYSTGYAHPPDHVRFIELPLDNGSNTLVVKHFNIGGSFNTFYSFKVDQIRFEKEAGANRLEARQNNHIEIELADPDHPGENLGTPNINLVIQEKKN